MAIPSDAPPPAAPVTAPLADVAALDGNGLACSSLPAGSLSGKIAFILRGTCTFQVKLQDAQSAGAVGALIYTTQAQPDPAGWLAGGVTLPAEMISWQAGTEIKGRLGSPLTATLAFTKSAVYFDPDQVASFSAIGPNLDFAIKPDLVAVGTNIYTAAESLDSNGIVYDPSGFTIEDGTSYSAPLVAGAAALLKAARPGLSAEQYRSLIVNSTRQISYAPGDAARVQQAGAGLLDAASALHSTVAASPVSLSFGVGDPNIQATRTLTLTNVGSAPETYLVRVVSRGAGAAPTVSPNPVQLNPWDSAAIPVDFTASQLLPGQYEGYITIEGSNSGIVSRVPYWYAVRSQAARRIVVLQTEDQPRAGSRVENAILFRVTDDSGVYLTDAAPVVTPVAGNGNRHGRRQRPERGFRRCRQPWHVHRHGAVGFGPGILHVPDPGGRRG